MKKPQQRNFDKSGSAVEQNHAVCHQQQKRIPRNDYQYADKKSKRPGTCIPHQYGARIRIMPQIAHQHTGKAKTNQRPLSPVCSVRYQKICRDFNIPDNKIKNDAEGDQRH